MSDVQQLPTRNEVPTEYQWDLTTIFKTDEEFESAFKAVQGEAARVAELKGTLTNAEQLLTGVKAVFSLYRHLERVYVYGSLKNDQDTSNATYQAMNARVSSLDAEVQTATAWFEPEVLQIAKADLDLMIAQNPGLQLYQQFFDELGEQRGHVLSPDQEKLLAGAADIFGASATTFSVLTDADLTFPVVQDDEGNDVQLTEGVYERLIQSVKPEVREGAFKALYRVYSQFRHTLASTLASQVKVHNYSAKVRHYESARQAAMSANHVPATVYESLVRSVNDHLDLLHRYVDLRKQILGLDTMHMWDLYTPITGKPTLKFTYEEAQQKALEALAVLGPDYTHHVQEAFDQSWIDVVENKGKRSGAYSGGMYDTNPFILLNWNQGLESLYTLVHEMGHSMHSYYTRHNQPYVYGDYSIFVAEIASTTNENLLTEHLLATEKDPKVRAYVLNHYLDGFKGTVFRQTQFAEFEDYIHRQDAAGQPLTADNMSDFYGHLNERYYGDGVVSDPQIFDEWDRIPHFYYDYYVYQYATGFAAATTLSGEILTGQAEKVSAYLDYLKAGSSDLPLNVMKRAGVDMTQTGYLDKAFETFENRLNEFETLSQQLK
ncbi:oligoendopeptidase F [Levilactobacillus bambusae]|uniref:Oligopeptidase F n=1 Tax=Levilactobacillus bambusae TaxID=2024736 RepID=A0A2V1N3W7_9LACO|nr:oligoendopeptidase F [Levilactobacillus bambusae]PWG00620.1 oligoendopeptidase F [Levilactobacillus bambusae]